jgi:hypothetical protein
LRPLKKRCRILPAGGLGVSPNFKKSPKIGGYRGLIGNISVISDYWDTLCISNNSVLNINVLGKVEVG